MPGRDETSSLALALHIHHLLVDSGKYEGFIVWNDSVPVDSDPRSDRYDYCKIFVRNAETEAVESATGHDAIAAYDYEDELPWSGGIRRPGADRDEPDVRGV